MQRQRYRLSWVAIAITLAICLGIGLRFHFLDSKLYWEDETFTSLRVAGYTRQELIDANFSGTVTNVESLKHYQRINPSKTVINTVTSMADDVHPPLYFVLLRWWSHIFGSSITAMRSFSTVTSIVLLPCLFLLAKELFNSAYIGYLVVGLNAVSPFYISIAQEARMYPLWAVFSTLSYLFLHRSLRTDRPLHWWLYGITTLSALYTHYFSVLMIASQGLYVLLRHRFNPKRINTGYFYALAGIVAGFLPWPIFVGRRLTYIYSQTTWTGAEISLVGEASLLSQWMSNLAQTFVANSSVTILYKGLPFVIGLILLGLFLFALYYGLQQESFATGTLLLLITINIFLPLAVADLLIGGSRSAISRYLSVSWIGVELAVAYLIFKTTRNLVPLSTSKRSFTDSSMVTGLLISGILIISIVSQSIFQFTFDSNQQPLVRVANFLNQRSQPLLISNIRPTQLLPLAHELAPNVNLQFVTRSQIPDIPTNFDDVFLYEPSGGLLTQLEKQGYTTGPVDKVPGLLALRRD